MLLKMTSLQASPQALPSIGAVVAVGVGADGAVTMAGGGGADAVGGGAGLATVVAVAAGFSRGNGPEPDVAAARLAAGFGRGNAFDLVAATDGVVVLTTIGACGE